MLFFKKFLFLGEKLKRKWLMSLNFEQAYRKASSELTIGRSTKIHEVTPVLIPIASIICDVKTERVGQKLFQVLCRRRNPCVRSISNPHLPNEAGFSESFIGEMTTSHRWSSQVHWAVDFPSPTCSCCPLC